MRGGLWLLALSLAAGDARAEESLAWVTPPVRAPGVEYRTFDSAAAGTKVSYHIYLPPAYATDKDRRFPVVYWLHGSGGGLPGIAQLTERFDAAIREDKIPPLLVVFPNGLVNGMYCDWKSGKAPVETVIIKELIPHIDAEFRTVASRDGRILDGFSMGGYGAARLGFKYPEMFGAVSIMGGGPLQQDFNEAPRAGPKGRDKVLGTVFGDDMEYYREQSPWRIAEQNAEKLRKNLRIRQVIGELDETLRFNREFHGHLEKLAIPHDYTELPGIKHDPMGVIGALGDRFWEFYRQALGVGGTPNVEGELNTLNGKAMAVARAYSEANGGQAMLVMHRGGIIYEGYANGGGADRRQTLASGTKSFVGVAAAAAVGDGLLRLDDPVCGVLAEWKNDPLKSKITYRQLLTLTSGLTPGERGNAVRSPGWKEILAKPMSGTPGGQFEYGAYHLCVFAEALQRRLGNETFEKYLARRILQPLDITLEWRIRCDDSNPQVGGGGAMTARDWATFGEFMRLGGVWNGKPIIDRKLLEGCVRGSEQNPAYGLTWWLKETVPDKLIQQVPILQRDMGDIVKSSTLPEDMFLAAGAGKQRLYVIPSMELVIVRQGDLRGSRGFSDAEFLGRLLTNKPTMENKT